MSPLRVLFLALCLAALVSLSAGQVSRAQLRICRSSCDATLSSCKAACGPAHADYAAQRCLRKCDEAVVLCKRDCRTVEADLTERQKKVWAKSGSGALAPMPAPEPVPAPFAPEEPAAPVLPTPAMDQPIVEQPAAAPALDQPIVEQPVATPVLDQPIVEQPVDTPVAEQPAGALVLDQPIVEQPAAAPALDQPIVEQPVDAPALDQPIVEQPVDTPVPEQTAGALVLDQPIVEQPAQPEPAAPAAPTSEPSADEAAAADAAVARAEEAAVAPIAPTEAAPAQVAPASEPSADEAAAADAAVARAEEAAAAPAVVPAPADAAATPEPSVDETAAAGAAVARAEETAAATPAAVPEPGADVPPAAEPSVDPSADAAADAAAAALPLITSTPSAIPASVAESAPFNLNGGGGVWRRGQPSAPRTSPSFAPSTTARRMTVAQLPVQAKLCMLLAEGSYRVKAVDMCPMVGGSGAASADEWRRVLQTFAREFRGSELQSRLSALSIVESSWDSVLFSSLESGGKFALYVGGHGSVMNSADWLGQNFGLSKVSQFVGSSVNWISRFFGKETRVDVPRQRSAHWIEAVQRALNSATYKGKVSKIHVFGHSMSAYQGHIAATALASRHPSIPLEAWLLNPGGNPPLPVTRNQHIHHLVVPGEAMQLLTLGGGDPRRIELQLQNINPAAHNLVNKPIYLHGVGLVTNDIRQFAGVAASVEVCTRPSTARGVSTDCYLRALDGSAAFQYDQASGVHMVRPAHAMPNTQCVPVPGVYMANLRSTAASDAGSREWSRGASYNAVHHNSCHWVNRALFAAGSTSVDSFVKGTLPKFKKFA